MAKREFDTGISIAKAAKVTPVNDATKLLVFSGDGRAQKVAEGVEAMLKLFTNLEIEHVTLGFEDSFRQGNANRESAKAAFKSNSQVGIKIATVTPEDGEIRGLLAKFNEAPVLLDALRKWKKYTSADTGLDAVGKRTDLIAQITDKNSRHIVILEQYLQNGPGAFGMDRDDVRALGYIKRVLDVGSIPNDLDQEQIKKLQDERHALIRENWALGVGYKSRNKDRWDEAGTDKLPEESKGRALREFEKTVTKHNVDSKIAQLQPSIQKALNALKPAPGKGNLDDLLQEGREFFRLRREDVDKEVFSSPNGFLRLAAGAYNLQRQLIPGLQLPANPPPQWQGRDVAIITSETKRPIISLSDAHGAKLEISGSEPQGNIAKKGHDLFMVQCHDVKAVADAATRFFDGVLQEMKAGNPVMPLYSTKRTVFDSDKTLDGIVMDVFKRKYAEQFDDAVEALVAAGKIKEEDTYKYRTPQHELTDIMMAKLISNPDQFADKEGKIRVFFPDAALGQQMQVVIGVLKQKGMASIDYLAAQPEQDNVCHRMGVGDHYGAICGVVKEKGVITLTPLSAADTGYSPTPQTLGAAKGDPYIAMQNSSNGFKEWAKQTVMDAVLQGKQDVYLGLSSKKEDGYYYQLEAVLKEGIAEAMSQLGETHPGNPIVGDQVKHIHIGDPIDLFKGMLTGKITHAAVGLPNYLGDIWTDIQAFRHGGPGAYISSLLGEGKIYECVHGTGDRAGENFNPIATIGIYAEGIRELGERTGDEKLAQFGRNLMKAAVEVVNEDRLFPQNETVTVKHPATTADMLRAVTLRVARKQNAERAGNYDALLAELKNSLVHEQHNFEEPSASQARAR